MFRPFLAPLAGLLLLSPAISGATAVTGSFPATANVAASCSMVINDLAFSPVDVLKASTWVDDASTPSADGTLSVTCTKGATVGVSMDAGQNAPATSQVRYLKSAAGDLLTYRIKRSNVNGQTFQSVWITGGEVYSFPSASAALANTILLRALISPYTNPSVRAGSYTDMTTVTLSF
jgi:spore coat protein U-like protein